MSNLHILFNKPTLSHSHCPTSSSPLSSLTPSTLHQSIIAPPCLSPKSYRYERVDNMFKLVQIRSNNSDPKQQTVHEDEDRMQKISIQIQELTNRVIGLELQQAKIVGIQKKVNEHGEIVRGVDGNFDYLCEKNSATNKEILEIRERLEEIQEQEGSYEKELTQIFRVVKEVKEEALGQVSMQKHIEKLYAELYEQLKKQIHLEIQNVTKEFETSTTLNSYKSLPSLQCLATKCTSQNQQNSKQIQIFKYRQSYQNNENTYSISQVIYKIDSMGRLLDDSGFILLDKNNKQITLNQQHLQKLRDFGLIQ